MEINKETRDVREQALRLHSNVMVEGDIIIPDVKPDIREVLLADAVAGIKTAEERGGILYVSGSVQFQILYAPDEEDCELTSVTAEFPFSDALDIPGTESMDYTVTVDTEHIGFSPVNSRKLSMKVIAVLKVKGYKNKTLTSVSGISENYLQCRTTEYNLFLPVCEKQKALSVSDLLTIPSHMPDMDEIIKVDAWTGAVECKPLNGKAMVRGTLHIQTLYVAANEETSVEQVSHEIPFSEILEAEQVDETCRVSAVCCVKEIKAAPRGDIHGDTKMIHADSVIEVCLSASKTKRETLMDDCYSINGELEVAREKTLVTEPVAQETISFTQAVQAALPKGKKAQEILSVSCKPVLRETSFENGTFHMKGTLVTFLLYREEGKNEKGKICSCITETEFDRTKPTATGNLAADCVLWTEDVSAERMGDGTVEIKVILGGNCNILRSGEVEYVSDISWHERDVKQDSCPSLVIYFIREGDTLWNIAKRYGTTVEKIKHANRMETDNLTVGNKLLIPKAG